jgi:hypothetical protein
MLAFSFQVHLIQQLPPSGVLHTDTPTQGKGYEVFNLYDLGEFDPKGGVATIWGTKDELLALFSLANESGIGLY